MIKKRRFPNWILIAGIILLLVIIGVVIYGKKPGNDAASSISTVNNDVFEIAGPDELSEHGLAEFTCGLGVGGYDSNAGACTSWSCVPPDAGIFESGSYPGSYIRFYPSEVESDTDVGIEVTIRTSYGDIGAFKVVHVFDRPTPSGWVRPWGGGSAIYCHDVAVDPAGDVFVAGHYEGHVDFDPGIEEDVRDSGEHTGVFLVKYTREGEYQWVHTWVGPGKEYEDYATPWSTDITRLAVDSDGNICIAGVYCTDLCNQVDGGGPIQSYNDIFISKVGPGGDEIWIKYWNGDITHTTMANFYWVFRISGIAMDSHGDLFVSGTMLDTKSGYHVDLDPGEGAVEYPTEQVKSGAVLLKLTPDGELEWSKVIPTTPGDRFLCLAVLSPDNRIWLLGDYSPEVDYDPNNDGNVLPQGISPDKYLINLDSDGNLLWSRSAPFNADYMAVDPNGNCFLAGTAEYEPSIEVKNNHPDYYAFYHVFIEKIDPNGDRLWQVSRDDVSSGLLDFTVDLEGDIISFGFSGKGSGEPPITGFSARPSSDRTFVEKRNGDGDVIWERYWGSIRTCIGMQGRSNCAIGCDTSGNVFMTSNLFCGNDGRWSHGSANYISGDYNSYPVDFDPGDGAYYVLPMSADSAYITPAVFLMMLPSDGSW